MKVLMQRKGMVLRPIDEKAQQTLARIKEGDVVWCDVTMPRNLKHNNLYWALMQLVCDNSDKFNTAEQVSDALKISLGHTDLVFSRDGHIYYKLRSISFSNMDQHEFSEYFERCVKLIIERFLPGVSDEEVRKELESMCGATYNRM